MLPAANTTFSERCCQSKLDTSPTALTNTKVQRLANTNFSKQVLPILVLLGAWPRCFAKRLKAVALNSNRHLRLPVQGTHQEGSPSVMLAWTPVPLQLAALRFPQGWTPLCALQLDALPCEAQRLKCSLLYHGWSSLVSLRS